MKRALLLSGAVAAILSAAPFAATAEEMTPYNAGATQIADTTAAGEVDAGKLIGEEVYDASGDKVGEIDSVMVDSKGKVTSVVIDVSGWLESEKLVAVPWSDLKTDADGKVVSALTKDSATAAAAYAYKDPALRKQVLTESGERYVVEAAPADGTQPAATADATATADTDTTTAIVNADGSLNASKLIGLNVQSPEDKKVGDIGEVVLDKGGQVQGVVVDVGGFLGIATHPVLLDWKDVTLATQDGKDKAIVNLTKEKLEQMPAYETSNR
jgi:sporulation protein YlmC with PRC-barrel domain